MLMRRSRWEERPGSEDAADCAPRKFRSPAKEQERNVDVHLAETRRLM